MISSKEIISVIQAIRDTCLESYAEDVQILSSRERDDRLGIYKPEDISDYLFHELKNIPVMQVPKLLKTPRLLKMALRRTIQAWETLHGEINFDDLFIANVLRYGAPEAFDFLIENFREVRGLKIRGILKDQQKRKSSLQAKWDNISRNVTWDTSAAEELVVFLFPTWDIKSITGGKEVLQGVNRAEPTDYWGRLNVEDLTDVKVRDQEVLKALINWKRDENDTSFKDMTLPFALYRTDFLAQKLEQFGNLFLNGKDIRRIAHSLFKIMLEKNGVSSHGKDCEAFFSLWRLSLDHPIDEKEHERWILGEIVDYLSKSLRFANDLYYYWKHNDRISTNAKKPMPGLRDPIITAAKRLFTNNPNKLIEVIDPNFIYIISQFSIFFSSPEEGGSGFNPEDWRWFASILVDAAHIEPRLAVPQIASLLVKSDLGVGQYIHEFDIERAASLFGDRLSEVMKLLTVERDYSNLNREEQERIAFAMEYSKEWIESQSSQDESQE